MHAPPRPAPTPGEMAAPGRPGPENFQECPAPPRPTPKMPRGLTFTPPRSFSPYPGPNFFSFAPPRSKKRLPRASLIFILIGGNTDHFKAGEGEVAETAVVENPVFVAQRLDC